MLDSENGVTKDIDAKEESEAIGPMWVIQSIGKLAAWVQMAIANSTVGLGKRN